MLRPRVTLPRGRRDVRTVVMCVELLTVVSTTTYLGHGRHPEGSKQSAHRRARRGAWRALLRRGGPAARPPPRGAPLGAERARRHVRLRGGVLRRGAGRHRARRRRGVRGPWAGCCPPG